MRELSAVILGALALVVIAACLGLLWLLQVPALMQ